MAGLKYDPVELDFYLYEEALYRAAQNEAMICDTVERLIADGIEVPDDETHEELAKRLYQMVAKDLSRYMEEMPNECC